MKHTNENPDFFDKDEIFHESLTDHKKKASISLKMIWISFLAETFVNIFNLIRNITKNIFFQIFFWIEPYIKRSYRFLIFTK